MTAGPSIAVVGMACVYADARSPAELWENVLAQRRSFRRLPPERLRRADYFSADSDAPDATYATEAAVIEGYNFDRVAFRVVGSTFRSADLAHWLALDVAARALADGGFAGGNGLPRETTGVLLGNTLTGEFSRANALRLRWPYVRRIVNAALLKQKWTAPQRAEFLSELETEYKSPFPPVGEETLAGGLSNTIAGRICNQFDLKGGGYTVDAACASSLLAVANACSALTAGDLDVAIAGGVDLSLDPFELVGFAKVGALAREEMRVFDRRSAGFWPGEGCGMVVLMRHGDALASGGRVYAVIRGWGISSDGSGGITRPEAAGQLEAIRRAYRRAGFGLDTVAYCECHGTGTSVGDATELDVLSRARREAGSVGSAGVGSIKANIGHTKAAAGVAGLLKATMAVHTQVLPPTTGCEEPHPLLADPSATLRVLPQAELWPEDRSLRASVSAMGFGGINTHIVIESGAAHRRTALGSRERTLSRSRQDAELFLFAAESGERLLMEVERVLAIAERISRAELTDLAAELQRNAETGSARAALVASKPVELAGKLNTLKGWLEERVQSRLDVHNGIFMSRGKTAPRLVFLFPGQGSPTHLDGGLWRLRFPSVFDLYSCAELPEEESVSTRVMQPAVTTASLAGLQVLHDLGVGADAAIGHSLGEITALHWAGAFDAGTLMRIARVRGAAMSELGSATGAMLALAAPWEQAQRMLDGDPLTVVGYNSPSQTVVAGEAEAIHHLARRAAGLGVVANLLPVSHAFHTPLVAAATPVLAAQLARETFSPLHRKVFSTVTGALLDLETDLRELLCRQVTSPVRFAAALEAMRGAADLFIEVGSGAVLSGLVRDTGTAPVVSLDAGGKSLRGLLQAVGAAFALGAPVKTAALFADRFIRPFAVDWKPKFFANPCELAPAGEELESSEQLHGNGPSLAAPDSRGDADIDLSRHSAGVAGLNPAPNGAAGALALIRALVAARSELPSAEVRDDSRMLSDLHLNSITVGQLLAEAVRQLGLPPIASPTEFANATIAQIARALEELKRTGGGTRKSEGRQAPAGAGSWVRVFSSELVEMLLPVLTPAEQGRFDPPKLLNTCSKVSEDLRWKVFAGEGHRFAGRLQERLMRAGGSGALVCLPENPGESCISLLLNAGRAVLEMRGQPRFMVVQHGWGGGGFARTLHLENPNIAVCIINVPAEFDRNGGDEVWMERIAAEVLCVRGFAESHLAADGRRFEPRLKLANLPEAPPEEGFPVGPDDVLLVTGGGKGIAAECALSLARQTGVKLALMGRSDPGTDKELAENLDRFAAAGVRLCHVRADVTDAEAVRRGVFDIQNKLGLVTAVLHGAGVNTPQLIGALDVAAFQRTVLPKISGLRSVLAAVDTNRLRLLATFGSIIARTGFPGEADYATANEWLAARTREFQDAHPGCRCLTIEWSVWSGAGMGERLGRVEALVEQGITPITVDEGVRLFGELMRRRAASTALLVTGRFGAPPTLKLAAPELPLRRFLERPRVYYPGIELVVDAELSWASDPYLADHVVQEQALFPAVLGLEAMAQTAMALAESGEAPVLENVEFTRPVTVSRNATETIRLAALQREAGVIEVCLRAEETGFQVDHFRAVCRFGAAGEASVPHLALQPFEAERLALDPSTDLYGRILFHRGRFRRLRHYRMLKAKECVAEVKADDAAAWFGPYLPGDFVLGNPAARDAALHAIQACIPHLRILPTGLERIAVRRLETGVRFVRARERSSDGSRFVYDVEVTDAAGELCERWSGVRLSAVEALPAREPWPDALLAPYLERRLEELVPGASVRVALERGVYEERPSNTNAVIQQALGREARIWRRPDGKPICLDGENVSASHAEDWTLAVAGPGGAACDLERVTPRAEDTWRDLLGGERFQLAQRIAGESSESVDAASTRLWAVMECLKKIGLSLQVPLVLERSTGDGWILFRSGSITIATYAALLRESTAPLVVAVALTSSASEAHLLPAGVSVVA